MTFFINTDSCCFVRFKTFYGNSIAFKGFNIIQVIYW